jgi:hypothetical protein
MPIKDPVRRRRDAVARMRAWIAAHPEKAREFKRNYRLKHPDAPRKYHLKRSYRLTIQEFDELLAANHGACWACDDAPRDGRPLHIDHNHECCAGARTCGACIRGLLCSDCNQAAGCLKDDPARFAALLRYLKGKHGVTMPVRRQRRISW